MVDVSGETIGLFPLNLPFFSMAEALYWAIKISLNHFQIFMYGSKLCAEIIRR